MKHIVIAPDGCSPALQAFVVLDTRAAIEAGVEALLARLDEMDGDTDIEANGDELDFNGAEDDFGGEAARSGLHWALPIGGCEDDEDDDPAGGNVEDEGERDDGNF